jgi:hypothetical protein
MRPIAVARRAALSSVIETNYGAAPGMSMLQGPEAALEAGLKAIEAFEQDREVDDVIAFLRTLIDVYRP